MPNYIHQSILSKSTRILVLLEMHDVTSSLIIMLIFVQISDKQIKSIKDTHFVNTIFVDGVRVINLI